MLDGFLVHQDRSSSEQTIDNEPNAIKLSPIERRRELQAVSLRSLPIFMPSLTPVQWKQILCEKEFEDMAYHVSELFLKRTWLYGATFDKELEQKMDQIQQSQLDL